MSTFRPRRLRAPVALSWIALAALGPAGALGAPHLGQRPLRAGMSGHDVRVLQRFLNEAGYRTAVDGHFGPATRARVRAFERAARLRPDGVLRPREARALRRARAGGPGDRRRLGVRALSRGMHGHDVRVLQALLSRAGFAATVDGAFGPGTGSALRAFERAVGGAANGILDAAEIDALRRAARAGSPGATALTPAPSAEPVARATVTSAGLALVPDGAPDAVRRIIAAGNRIATMPYRYGGGHGRWRDAGYDCSGSISYALHGAGLLHVAHDSSQFTRWGAPGRGRWVTVYGNPGHAFMVVAGLRFDTSSRGPGGSRWTAERRSPAGYVARHPQGL